MADGGGGGQYIQQTFPFIRYYDKLSMRNFSQMLIIGAVSHSSKAGLLIIFKKKGNSFFGRATKSDKT